VGGDEPDLPLTPDDPKRVADAPRAYATHRDYLKRAAPLADVRYKLIREKALEAFHDYIREERCLVVQFADMNATELGRILAKFPALAKPLMILCGVAERAIERDLGLKGLSSYSPCFQKDSAKTLAGYLKPFLPDRMELDSFCAVDRLMFLDKEIRKGKGQWEKLVRVALSAAGEVAGMKGGFKKRKFEAGREFFELDAAYPGTGDILIGVDIKRIEARRDIHKRCDEIVNKAAKFKGIYRKGKFVAFIYYPFLEEQTHVTNRLRSENVDVVVFASENEDSIRNAAISALKTQKR
jgi:hypothetical protein